MFNSELVQKTIVGSVMVCAMVSIVMLMVGFNNYQSKQITRAIASIHLASN